MRTGLRSGRTWWSVATVAAALWAAVATPGCRSAGEWREQADEVAEGILKEKQAQALGRHEAFTIETPADTLRRRLLAEQGLPISGAASMGSDALEPIKHWPEEGVPARTETVSPVPEWNGEKALTLTLLDALMVGARNSRDYQTQKENVFRSALDLDLEIDRFRNTYVGLLEGILITDTTDAALLTSASATARRRLETGGTLATRVVLDVAQLLSSDRSRSLGLLADATITIPLLRGAGRHIATEPLTQAERNVVYAIWNFERFKRTFAVRIASDYLAVLRAQDQVANARANYERLIRTSRRTQRLADAGRSTRIQVDQAIQQELSARDNWIRQREQYQLVLDRFKIALGLPTDSRLELDRRELDRIFETVAPSIASRAVDVSQATPLPADAPVMLSEPLASDGGPYEMDSEAAIRLALENRLDLRVREGRVYDAQRAIVVAANALEAGLTLTGSAAAGERRTSIGAASRDDAVLRFDRGIYSTGLLLDLPWERTAERNIYRDAFIRLERSVRDVQELEDQIKLDIRSGLRSLLQARESFRVQRTALELAFRRVESTALFLEAGRPGVQIRDVLDAERDLLNAQNAQMAALINYRVTELELQRDMDVLEVDEKGLWREYDPDELP